MRVQSFLRTVLPCALVLLLALPASAAPAPQLPAAPGLEKVLLTIYDASGIVQAKNARILTCSYSAGEQTVYSKSKSELPVRGVRFNVFSLTKKPDGASLALQSLLANGTRGGKAEFVFSGKQGETMRFSLHNPRVLRYALRHDNGNTAEQFDLEYDTVTVTYPDGTVTLAPPRK